MVRWVALWLCLLAQPLSALQLDLPRNARLSAERDSALDQVSLPTSGYVDGAVDSWTAEGNVQRRAYRIPTPGLTPLQIIEPMRAQVEAAGFEVLLDCNQTACGGFDFRFAIDVLPAPNMYVNIRAYHVVTARSADQSLMLLASASNTAAYLQIIQVAPATPPRSRPVVQPAKGTAPSVTPVDRLLEQGFVTLEGVTFDVGGTTLNGGPSDELQAIAELLAERPGLRIAVVGHTDTSGSLEANINVSRARAQAVRSNLIERFGADGARISAEGMGYLAPRANNLTPEGRKANRRVDVILIDEAE